MSRAWPYWLTPSIASPEGLHNGRKYAAWSWRTTEYQAASFSAFAHASYPPLRSLEWEIYVAACLLGIGLGFAVSAMANLIVQNVPQEQIGVATG